MHEHILDMSWVDALLVGGKRGRGFAFRWCVLLTIGGDPLLEQFSYVSDIDLNAVEGGGILRGVLLPEVKLATNDI